MKQPIPSLYVLKALCAFLVVTAHFPGAGKEQMWPVFRLAVPLFFMMSGYFLYASEQGRFLRRIRKAFIRILKLCLAANFIYLVFGLVFSWVRDVPLETEVRLFSDFSFGNLLLLLAFGDSISTPLWYLTAYGQALACCYLLVRTGLPEKHPRWVLTCACVLCAAGVFLGVYGFKWGIGLPLYATRNFLFLGLPFVWAGAFIRKYEDRIFVFLRPAGLYVLAAFCLAMAFSEYVRLCAFAAGGSKGDLYFFTPFLAAAVLFLALRYKTFTVPFLETVGKRYSENIYVYHMMIGALVTEAFSAWGGGPVYHAFGGPVVFALTLLVLYPARKVKSLFLRLQKA